MDNVLSDELFISHLRDGIRSIFQKYNDIVYVGTITYIQILFEAGPYETIFCIHVKLLVGHYHFGCFYAGKISQFGFSFPTLAILFLNLFKVIDGECHQVIQVIFHLLHLSFKGFDVLIGTLHIILGDPFDLDVGEFDDVFPGYFP